MYGGHGSKCGNFMKYKGYDLSSDFKDVVQFPVTSFHIVKPGMDIKYYYHSPFR